MTRWSRQTRRIVRVRAARRTMRRENVMTEIQPTTGSILGNRWGDLTVSEQIDKVWCVGVDIVRTPEGRHAVKVTTYDHDEKVIDVPALRAPIPLSPPAMHPYDCPLPLWLAYSAVSQVTEAFLRGSSEFTLG